MNHKHSFPILFRIFENGTIDFKHLYPGDNMNRLILRASLSVVKELMQSTLLSLLNLNLKFEDFEKYFL